MQFLVIAMLLIANTYTLAKKPPLTIVIHGGAGTILKKNLDDKTEKAIHRDLEQALQAGYEVLQSKGTATDAIIAAITLLENSPYFNAGKGAVYTKQATHELDASIMRGSDLQAGAVAGVKRVKNPILAARAVMLHSPHVMLSGNGADEFAKLQKLELVDNHYYDTKQRYKSWEKAHSEKQASLRKTLDNDFKFGTVGAVAIDFNGNIAAGTSTGGMTYKAYGRIGDSPVIGAGTYADNRSCGISSTGHGEFFIRHAVAYNICARARLTGETLTQSATYVIHNELKNSGGSGGIIGVDPEGNPIMIFNTPGMYRGYKTSQQDNMFIGIYKNTKK